MQSILTDIFIIVGHTPEDATIQAKKLSAAIINMAIIQTMSDLPPQEQMTLEKQLELTHTTEEQIDLLLQYVKDEHRFDKTLQDITTVYMQDYFTEVLPEISAEQKEKIDTIMQKIPR